MARHKPEIPLTSHLWQLPKMDNRFSHRLLVGFMMLVALIAFELFNFDTTRYALSSLIGDIQFLGIDWAVILAIAFCAIDFAGLFRLFTPEQPDSSGQELWYLMGAWILGTTMNALMTWWAVSLTLLDRPLGNELLSRETLLKIVPIFVAFIVWLTRILFIASINATTENVRKESSQTREFGESNAQIRERTKSDPPSRKPISHSAWMGETVVTEETETELLFVPPPTIKRKTGPMPNPSAAIHH